MIGILILIMRQNPFNHNFQNSICHNDDEVSNSYPGSHLIALSYSPHHSLGSTIRGASEVPTPPKTEKGKVKMLKQCIFYHCGLQ